MANNRGAFARQEDAGNAVPPFVTAAIGKIQPFRLWIRSTYLLIHIGRQAADEISDRHKSRLSLSYEASRGYARKWSVQSIVCPLVETIRNEVTFEYYLAIKTIIRDHG